MEIKIESTQIQDAINSIMDQRERLKKLSNTYKDIIFAQLPKSKGMVAEKNMDVASDEAGMKSITLMMKVLDKSLDILKNARTYEEKDLQIASEIKKGC